jgi:hypothetical protein
MTNNVLLPINIVNKIMEDASILNEDNWIPQFKEVTINNSDNNFCKKRLETKLYPNYNKYSKLTKILKDTTVKKCILNIDNGMYIQSYDLIQNICECENGEIIQYHNIKTVGFFGGKKNTVMVNIIFKYNPITQTYTFVDKHSSVFIIETKSRNQVRSSTFVNGILKIYLYEFNGSWQWNENLQIIEYVVDVDVENNYDGYDDYDDFYSDEEFA